ncbi:hypothetical protein [Flavobacterium sp.]|uniref:hypothetical protein n=1 Tax=Flavobacterium sp. TaxID=239 RepID=UPI003D6BB64E
MKDKRPIDKIRESSGHAEIGSAEDGAIIEMKNIGNRILIIKEKSIYEMVMADSIDPDRTNINLPTTIHKLIIDKGAESETVSRTLLTAMTLFRTEYMLGSIDCNKVIGLTIDILSEISILEKEIDEYQKTENKVSEEYEERKNQNVSYKLPSIINLESKCKTIFQKADHIEQTLMEIITVFYPNQGLTKQSHFPNFCEILKTKYGETDPFVEFIKKTLFFMQVIRELRNGFDHRLEHTTVLDFELQTDGNILKPTIELKHKKIKLERTSLSEFLEITTKNMLDITELIFVLLASKNNRNIGIPHEVRQIPEDQRRNKFVKYCFWSPIGNGGFYSQ